MSRPKTSWPVLLFLVLWYVDRTVKATATMIPIHGSASYTYVSLYYTLLQGSLVLNLFSSMIFFTCGLSEEAGLVLIPYSFSIKLFKIVTKELSSLIIHDFYWAWILDQPHSFHQVHDCHSFLVALLCYFRPLSYEVYHCNVL